MTKREDTGELISRPTKPPRRFPWRLWTYAILVTGVAGAGGYFTYTFRERAKQAVVAGARCDAEIGELQSELAAAKTSATDTAQQVTSCRAELDGASTRVKEMEAQLAQTSTNLSASMEELATLRAQRAEAEKRLTAMAEIQKQFAEMIGAGQLAVTARRGSLVLSLPSEVLFASGSADVSEKGTLAVLEIGIILKKLDDRRFMVLGHTDDVPLKGSTYKDNWELSTARALNVTRTLVKAGMDPKNLVPAGVGEHDPLGKDRAKNRRIEIVLLPAISELPPLPELAPAPAAAPAPVPKKT